MDFDGRRNPWETKSIANADEPFICEMPVSDNLAGTVACSQAAARAGVVAATGLDRRLDADTRALGERVRGGEIGAVETVYMVLRSAGSPFDPGVQRGSNRNTK